MHIYFIKAKYHKLTHDKAKNNIAHSKIELLSKGQFIIIFMKITPKTIFYSL